mgnify:CR=1 FL=1
MTKNRKFMGLIAGLCLSLSSCATSNYTKQLEEIVRQECQVVSVEQRREEVRERVSVEYCNVSLPISDGREINVDVYTIKEPVANIILLPTLGEPASSLEKFSEEMASYGYNVYGVDVEGFGKSSGERGEIALWRVEEDISKAIDYIKSLNDRKIVLAGTSIGSDFSLFYSAEGEYKEEISGVVAHGSFVPSLDIPFNPVVSFCKTRVGSFLARLAEGKKINMLSHLRRKNFYANEEQLKEVLEDPDYAIEEIGTKGYLDFIRYKPEMPVTSYNGEVLFMISKDDRIIPFRYSIALYDALRKENPNIVLYIPFGRDSDRVVPHMSFDVNYQEIAEQINVFLRSVLAE